MTIHLLGGRRIRHVARAEGSPPWRGGSERGRSRSLVAKAACAVLAICVLVRPAAAQAPPAGPARPAVDTAAVAAREQQARQAMADGRFDDAARAYREMLQALPNEPGLLMNFGMALAMGGHSREAIEPLAEAVKLRPALQPAWLFLGSTYLDLGEPEKAIAPLRKFVTAQPADVNGRQMLATALLVSGHPREALTHFQRLTKLAPREAKAWVGLVQCYDALAQEAIDRLGKAPNADIYQQLALADAFEADEKNEQAFALYRNALTVDTLPRAHGLHIHDALAQIYEKTGHPDWAAAERAKADAIPLDCKVTGTVAARKVDAACEFRAKRFGNVITALQARTDAESHYWRARAYAELGVEAFGELAKLPASQELHELKAELFRNEGRHLQSVEELKAALTFAPADARLQKELAKSYLLSRDAEHARPLLEALVKHQPDDPEVPLLYGEVLLEAQQVEEALPYLKAAAARDPASMNIHAALGRALAQSGQAAEAIPHLKAALPQDEDGSLRYQLARAYQATGQPDLAKPLLEEYQALQRAAQARAQTAPADAKITPP
jgi:tetratricopeptide (TPR) repeat protein